MRDFRYILTFFLWTLSFTNGFSTGQIPDRLIYQGDTISIYANPLEQLYGNDTLRPKFFGIKEGCGSTACWRGYQAEWTIIDNEIYLTGIFSCCCDEDKIKADLNLLFGDKCIDNKVKANWVTGDFISPQGKLLNYVHMGYASTYEKEVEFQFKDGKLIRTRIYDNSKSRTSIYKEDQKKLMEFINRQINWRILPKNKEKIRIFVQFSANSQGIIDSTEILRGYNPDFDKETIRVIRTIPKWDILYSHGEFMRMKWTMPVIFSNENRRKYGHKK